MTMNLRFGLARDGGNGWEHRKFLVAKLLKKYPADFWGIQEVNHFQADFLRRTLSGYRALGQHNLSFDRWQSNMIFFHPSWECLEQKHYFLSDTPDVTSKFADSKWPRQCVMGMFKKNKERIVVVNTHFDFLSSVQEKSASLIVKWLSKFSPGLPVLITGDFNANPGSRAHTLFKTHGFAGVFDEKITTTFHDFEGKDTGKQLDWILYRGGLSPVFSRVVKDSFSNRFPSDHYPVRAVFKWPEGSYFTEDKSL